jgi:hypothetical protein
MANLAIPPPEFLVVYHLGSSRSVTAFPDNCDYLSETDFEFFGLIF